MALMLTLVNCSLAQIEAMSAMGRKLTLSARSRNNDQDKADHSEDRTTSDPRPLVNHEARCRPMDQARTLADPQQSHKQCGHSKGHQEQSHG
jgi:hypothetical protein